jgi:hypothetical protein
MKNIKKSLTPATIALLVTISVFSCKKKESTPDNSTQSTTTGSSTTTGGTTTGVPTGVVNTGSLNLFIVDTAKILSATQQGANQTIIVNKTINSSSYIGNLSLENSGTKLVYSLYQQAPYTGTVMGATTRELRIANANGSNDIVLHTINTPTISYGAIRYGVNNKVYFMKEAAFPSTSYSICTVNTDGTGFQSASGLGNVKDISIDGNYYLTSASTPGGSVTSITVIDKNGDNGAGSLYMLVNTSAFGNVVFGRGEFTVDNKKACIPYLDGTNLKILILDLVTKTSSSKTVVTNFTAPYIYLMLHMASDSNRGVLTVSSNNSVSYIIDINAGTLLNQFNNNDNNVSNVSGY